MSNVVQTIKVERNIQSGQVTGWDQFFKYIEQQKQIEEEDLNEARKVSQEIDAKVRSQKASYTVQ